MAEKPEPVTFVGTEAASARIARLRARSGAAERIDNIRAEMKDSMTNLDALSAARQWAEQHGHQQPDDRMLDAYGVIIRKEALKEALDCIPQGNTNIFCWFKDRNLNTISWPGHIFAALRADLEELQ